MSFLFPKFLYNSASKGKPSTTDDDDDKDVDQDDSLMNLETQQQEPMDVINTQNDHDNMIVNQPPLPSPVRFAHDAVVAVMDNNTSTNDDIPLPPAPAPAPPTTSNRKIFNSRMRSISKLFTTLPTAGAGAGGPTSTAQTTTAATTVAVTATTLKLPSYLDIQLDVIEYFMYVILLLFQQPILTTAILNHTSKDVPDNKTICTTNDSIIKQTKQYQQHLVDSVGTLNTLLNANENSNLNVLQQPNRLTNRIALTAIICDIVLLCEIMKRPSSNITTENSDDHNDDDNNEKGNEDDENAVFVVAASELPSRGWFELKNRFVSLKSNLLKRNANAPPKLVLNNSNTTSSNNGNDHDDNENDESIDEQLVHHMMMTIDYEEVICLLSVQEEITKLKEQLEEIQEDSHNDDNNNMNQNSSEHSTMSTTSIMNKSVQVCVNQFMKNLLVLFPPPPPTTTKTTDNDNDDDSAEPTCNDKDYDDVEELNDDDYIQRRVTNIPKELHDLALVELYSPRTNSINHITTSTTISGDAAGSNNNNINNTNSTLVDRLLHDIYCITTKGSNTTTSSSVSFLLSNTVTSTVEIIPGRFSYTNLFNKIRSLLMKWSESILDVPTLVQLGYGGIPSPIIDKEEDDVSSWGDTNTNHIDQNIHDVVITNNESNDNLHDYGTMIAVGDGTESHQRERERRSIIQSRSRSITRLLNASLQGQRKISISAEEKDIITQLAALAAAEEQDKKDEEINVEPRELPAVDSTVVPNTATIGAIELTENVVQEQRPSIIEQQDNENDNANEQHSNIATAMNVESPGEPQHNNSDDGENLNLGLMNIDVSQPNSHTNTPSQRPFVKASKRLLLPLSNFRRGIEFNKINLFDINVPQNKKRSANSIFSIDERQGKIRRQSTGNLGPLNQRNAITTPLRNSSVSGDTASVVSPPKNKTKAKKATPEGNKPKKVRSFFTQDEVDALVEGINKYSEYKFKWSMIQKNDVRLKNRTAVQLKDKYRTMVANKSLLVVESND